MLTVEDPTDEVAVNRMALLFQASDATAGLIGNAVVAAAGGRDGTVDELVAHTNRMDPSVQHTLRRTTAPLAVEGTTIPPGATIVVDLASANRERTDGHVFTFGLGRRRCPGAAHALALAAGVLSVVLEPGVQLLDPTITYDPRPNVHLPQQVRVRFHRSTSSPTSPAQQANTGP